MSMATIHDGLDNRDYVMINVGYDAIVPVFDWTEALAPRQGKRAEARPLLADIYDWFTEGFATADLQEAKALLDELA
jgi:hypothetical protein